VDWILISRRWGVAGRLVLGALWGWSSWVHLGDPHTFLRAVQGYGATPDWLSKGIAYGMPMLGLCVAALLVIGMLTRYAAAASGLLQLAILVGALQAWARGRNNASGFLGGAGLTDSPRYPLVALFALVLIAGSAWLTRWPVTALSMDARAAQAAVLPEASARARRTPRALQRHQAQVERRRQQVRNEQLFLSSSVAVLVVLISIVAMAVQAQRSAKSPATTAAHATVDNGVVWGVDSAPVTVDLYEDFKCVECQQFQQATAAELHDLVFAGKLRIRYYPIAYIQTGTDGFSSRAANSALCASDISADVFVAFQNAAFAADAGSADAPAPSDTAAPTDTAAPADTAAPTDTAAPADTAAPTDTAAPSAASEPTGGNTAPASATMDDKMLALGAQASINDAAFSSCVTGNTHRGLVSALTDRAMSNGVSSAPVVFANGARLSAKDAAGLRIALLDAVNQHADAAVAGGKILEPYTPAPTGSPSPADDTSGTGDSSGGGVDGPTVSDTSGIGDASGLSDTPAPTAS
jgi:protein-disulfide isomerase